MSDIDPSKPDATKAPDPSNRRKATVTDTAAISMTTAGVAGMVTWGFECYNAGRFMTPDQATAMLMAGFIMPVLHAARDALVKWINSY